MNRARSSRTASRISFLLVPLLLAGCRSTPPPKPLDQLTADEARGHEIYMARCSRCHYDRETGDLHGPSLLGLYKKQYLPSGAPANDDRVDAVIEHGRNMMPAIDGLEPGSPDFSALIAYLHTL
jgi:mono/diheme cytochrome c family protein